ncbi:MAG TPA: hypothetical protein VI457_06910, partial [Methylococcaceae bacterium]|nr:hypothetical protein [Methylococcaceae bacterium]
TPRRLPYVLSPHSASAPTPTKHPALRLRGGRRTPFVRYRSLSSCAPSQKVYTLSQANQSLHSTLLTQISIDIEARQEIQNALAAGLEVMVHQAPITVSGWTGSGYILLDKDTGAGAYKISGGENGGEIPFACGFASGALSYFFGIAYGVQHIFERAGNDRDKAILAETILGGVVYMYGNDAYFRTIINDMLWDNMDFIAGKLFMGFLVGMALSLFFGAKAIPIAVALQLFSTIGYLLGIDDKRNLCAP